MFFLEVNLEVLAKLNNRVKSQLKNTDPIVSTMRNILFTDIQRNFTEQHSPEGKPWIQSKSALEENRLTLVDTRELKDGLKVIKILNQIIVKASDKSKEYAPKHQFGGVIRLNNGEDFKLPQRKFAGLSEEGHNLIKKIILERTFSNG